MSDHDHVHCTICDLPLGRKKAHKTERDCIRALAIGITRLTERCMSAEKHIRELDNRTGGLMVCK